MLRLSPFERAGRDERQGKSASTQAGEFVREEFDHIRAGKHGARSARQAIAIGLSKARRAGVKLAPPRPGKASAKVRHQAERDYARGQQKNGKRVSQRRSRATLGALKKEPREAASHRAISTQVHHSAHKRSALARSQSARKAAAARKKNND